MLYAPPELNIWDPTDEDSVAALNKAEYIVSSIRRDAREGRGAASAALGLLCACTLLVALGLSFSNYRNFISQYAPGKYLALYRLFTLR